MRCVPFFRRLAKALIGVAAHYDVVLIDLPPSLGHLTHLGLAAADHALCVPVTPLGDDCGAYPGVVARAVDQLHRSGIEGPYALAVGPDGYTRIVETTEHGGYPLFEHLQRVLGGDVVWAPGVAGAMVLSQRGGDFLLDVGQDLAVGYSHHDADTVHLYLEESFTFRVVERGAAVALS